MNSRLAGVLLAAATLLIAALSTGAQLYYLIFATLIAMLVLGLLSAVWTAMTVHIDLTGVKKTVTRNETMMCVFTVKHACILPVASIRITLSVPSQTSPTQEVRVNTPPFATRIFRHMIHCPHRGVYNAGISKVTVCDLFGFFRISRKPHYAAIPVEVLPRHIGGRLMELDASDVGVEFRAQNTEDASSPSDTRPWRDGDSLKKVHWKLSMRKRELMVRTFEESARPDTLLIPDMSEITAMSDERLTLEDCICEYALGAAKAQMDAGFPVRMPLMSMEPSEISGQNPADVRAFETALLHAKFDSPYAYEKVLIRMTSRMQRTGGAILVTAKLTMRVADAVIRMQQSGIRTRLIWITDDSREETLLLAARMRMAKVDVQRVDPWIEEAPAADEFDAADAFL